MSKQIIINVTGLETRVALLEKGELVELFIETPREKGVVGNIYKGKVEKVLPGMQASFVDIGLERNAFLFVSDIQREREELERMAEDAEESSGRGGRRRRPWVKSKVEELVREGEEILLQVTKEPTETKGARITTHISIPGRYLVLMPNFQRIGVSRKIDKVEERKRLRQVLNGMKPRGLGFIIRTAARGIGEREIRQDLDSILSVWKRIQKRRNFQPGPILLHEDLDLPLRVIRDLFSPEVKKVVLDSASIFDQAREYYRHWIAFRGRRREDPLELYRGKAPIFDHYGIEAEIERAIKRRVWLKSGGYLVIDEAEALTTIDVNTGKYVGKRNVEETILKTNLEAAREIAKQLRLRNIGGIIIVDFIDMEKENHRNRVYNLFREVLRADRSKVNILRISEFGLVEMTRERTRRSLTHTIGEPCLYCEGSGFIKSLVTISHEIYREVQREASSLPAKKITIHVHPDVAELLKGEERHILEEIKERFKRKVALKARPELHREEFQIT